MSVEKPDKINPIDKYLNTFSNRNTINNNKTHLNTFFKIINAKPETYFEEDRDYEKDVRTFWNASLNKMFGTRRVRLTILLNFLEDNNVVINKRFIKNLKRRCQGTIEGKDGFFHCPYCNSVELQEI